MLGTMLHHRFRLEQVLHRGTSGTLYLATDDRTGEMLAVKVFPPHTDFASEDGLRYARAMARAAGLSHAHLLLPRFTGMAEGVCFQVLPYYPGEVLPALLSDGPLPPAQVVHLLLQLTEALAALHAAGLSHLNLKPGNVLVSREEGDWQVVLCDALRGLLTPPSPDDTDSASACCLAPEQTPWLEADVDGRADFYALGALGYLLATGQPPFSAANAAEIWHRHTVVEAPFPGRLRPELPHRLARALRTLLAPRPRDRFPDAASVQAELLAALAELSSGGPMEALKSHQDEPVGRHPGSPVASGVMLGGRHGAQEAVLSALARASTGPALDAAQGNVLWVTGESGSGRTALIRDLLPHLEAAHALVLRVEAPPEAVCPPFHLPVALLEALVRHSQWLSGERRKALAARLQAALGDLADVPTALVPALRMLLPDAPTAEPLPLGRERARTLHALCEPFLVTAEPGRPLVLWLEHVERADADSLDWLTLLARRVTDAPLLVLASVTPDAASRRAALEPLLAEGGSGVGVTVPVDPLQPTQVTRWLAETLAPGLDAAADVPERLGRWLCERWGGLPLFHGLALRVLLARGVLWREEGPHGPGAWQVDWDALESGSWPESQPALVQHRLELVPDETVPVMQAVATAPEGLDFIGLCALLDHLPPSVLMDAVEQAVAEQVLEYRHGRLAFRHGALREAVWRALPESGRAENHLTLGAELEQAGDEATLAQLHAAAEHFRAGGDAERTVASGLQLVGRAWEQGAMRAVCRWSDHLLEPLQGHPRRPELLSLGGMAHARLGDADAAIARLDDARALGLPELSELDARAHAAWAEQSRGNVAEALRRVEEALEWAGEPLPAEGMGMALARLSGAALRRYEALRAAAAGGPTQPLTPRERRLVTLLAQASELLAASSPHRALLADERILRIAAGRTPSPHLVRALVRLGEADGDPDGPYFDQARTVLDRHGFPHAAATLQAVLGGCRLAAGQWTAARESLRGARMAFRALGAVADEAESLLWLVELLRLEGTAERLSRAASLLEDAARRGAHPRVGPLAEGLQAYAMGYAGERPPAAALEGLESAVQALHAAGETPGAHYLLALGCELALAAGDLGGYLALLRHSRATARTTDYGAGLLLAVRAEGHLVQAGLLPEEADHHLQQARTLLRDLRALHGWPLRADLARVDVLERFHTTADEDAKSLATEALDALDAQGARLPAAWLRFRVAEALKTAGDQHWMRWAGEALTAFDAFPAPLHLQATRRLLDLETATGPAASRAAAVQRPSSPRTEAPTLRPDADSPGDAASTLAMLLQELATRGPRSEASLRSTLLETLMGAVDATTGVWLKSAMDGRPDVAGAVPPGSDARRLAGTSLAESVWREGRAHVLDHYRPPAVDGPAAGSVPEALSLLGLPLPGVGAEGGIGEALVLAAPIRRTVFDRSHLAQLQPLWEQAAALRMLNERLLEAQAQDRTSEAGEDTRRSREAWAGQLLLRKDPADLLRACLEAMVPAPPPGSGVTVGLLALRDGDGLRLAAAMGVKDAERALADAFPLSLKPGRAEAALRRRAPVSGTALDTPPATKAERTLLHRLGATRECWLPLVHASEAFGVVLLAFTGEERPMDGPPTGWMETLTAAAPAFHAAWRAEQARTLLAREAERAARAERQAVLALRLLPPDWPTEPAALEEALQDGLDRTAPVLAGEVRGLMLPESGPATAWREALRTYYGQVRHGLSLHEGTLLRVQHPQWIAAYPGTVDSALWGAQTLHQLLLGLEAELLPDGGLPPITGLGLHLGRLSWEPLADDNTATPTLAGQALRMAARLAAMSRTFRCGILVSRETVDALAKPTRFDLRPLGRLRPSGGNTRLEVFELYSVRDEGVRGSMRTLQGLWDDALREFRMGRWHEAAAGFARYAQELPQDRPARYFLRQSRQRAQG